MKVLFYCGIHNLVNFSRIRPYYDLCYGFDANPEKIEYAQKFYANDPNVKIVYGALTEKGGEEIEFVITTDWTPASSLGQPNPDFVHMKTGLLQAQKKIKVPTVNLYDFCLANGIQEIDTLITDLQGIDLAVVKTMTPMIKKGKIREIQCEVEPDHMPPRYLGIPTGKFSEFSQLLSGNYDVLWIDPDNPKQHDNAWEMDIRWRVKGGHPPDGIEFVMEKELLVPKNIPVAPLASYSQYREDLVIDALFKHKSGGFYVDIGANDPEVLSNTKLFYMKGWQGINVEPEPNLHAKLCIQRTRDLNIKAGVGPQPGIMTFYRMSADTLSSFNKQAALQAGKLYGGTLISEEQTQVVTLRDLLAEHLNDKKIDFMSVDAEGYDLAVLESNDWSRFRPSLIIVEINVCGDDIVIFLQKQNYILIFDNGTNGIFIAKEFCDTIDDDIKEDLNKLKQKYALRTVLPCQNRGNKLTINIVYGHLPANQITSRQRGNVTVLWSSLPIEDCDHYVYHNSFSYRGRLPGLNILLMLEPAVVLPGEFNEEIWDHFDHIIGLFDYFEGKRSNFDKILFPRADIAGKNPVTEIQSSRELLYPLTGRKNAICLIAGNKSSLVPYELYSKRIEAAQWFSQHSTIPFDVYGIPPFKLPNYRGIISDGQKLAVLKQYRFSLCFENTNDPILSAGYVTEKILDCLETRTVPIYLGAVNIEKYIPKNCFIDFRKFNDYALLDQYLRGLSDEEYEQFISAIDQWVNTGNLNKYSAARLLDTLTIICAEASSTSLEKLFNGKSTWVDITATPPSARHWKFINKPLMWTWKHLAKAEPPSIASEKIITFKSDVKTSPLKSEIKQTKNSFFTGSNHSLKILTVGTKFFSGSAHRGYDYAWWNMYDSLNRFKNIQMHFFDYATEAQQRGIAGMSDVLTEIVHNDKPDILFYIPSNIPAHILSASLKSITDLTNTQTIVWMDDDNEYFASDATLWSSCADYIITTSIRKFNDLQRAGFNKKIIKSQWAFNPFTYHPNITTKTRAISFVGSSSNSRSAIIDSIRQSGLFVDTFGDGWHEDSFIPFIDILQVMGQSKINLNLGNTSGLINKRTFEIPGCRGFLLSMPAHQLENYYEPGKEIIIASSTEELIDKAKFYLAHEQERERIAQYGYKRTLAEHTWTNRFIDIFKHIGFKAVPSTLKNNNLSETVHPSHHDVSLSLNDSKPSNTTEGAKDIDVEEIEASIVVMGFNKLEYTKQCVESILQYTKGSYEILLTDNGSTDGTFEYFEWVKSYHPNTRVIKNFANRIVEALGNYVFSLSRGKYIVGVANDAIVHDGWLDSLIRHIESEPGIGIVGTRSNNISGPQFAQGDYDTLEAYHKFAAEWSRQHRGSNFTIQRLVGIAAIMKKTTLERIGNVDPDLPVNGKDGGYGFSDDDISIRLMLAGYKLLVANDVFIHHFGSVTTSKYRPDLFGAPQNINKEKYLKKLRNNDRISIGVDGKITLRPYCLDDMIPVDERTVIRTPRVCFMETKCDISGKADADNRYSAVTSKYNGQVIGNQNESVQSLILKILDDKQYDSLVLIDSRLAPAPEIISALTDVALCYPDVAVMVPVGNYAPATHSEKSGSTQNVELIPYADLSICTVNLKIIRPLRSGLANCKNDDDFLWFLQRRVRGESYFIAKANDIIVNAENPSTHHPYDEKILPEQLIKEKKCAEAVAIYSNDVLLDPTFAQSYHQLACIAREQGQEKEAIKQAEQALLADPHHIESLIFLSRIFMEQNDWKRAESFVRQANFKQPGNPDVQKIVEQYEKVIKENPDLLQKNDVCKIPDLTNAEFVKDRTSIIIAAVSNHSRECITAIKKHTKESYELIVIDALTSPDSKKKLRKSVKEHVPYVVMEHATKDSLLQSINKAINCSTGEYIVLLNDDVIVSESWLAGMLSCLNHAATAGIVGPMTNTSKGLQESSDESYQSLNKLDQHAAQVKEKYKYRRIPCRNVAGFCMLFKRTLAGNIGLLDENFTAGQLADEDFCWRSALANYQNYIAGDVFVHCYGENESSGNENTIDQKWDISTATPDGKKMAVLKALELSNDLYSRGKVDQALQTLVDCIKIAPEADGIYFQMIRIFLEAKKFGEAWAVIDTMPDASKNKIQTLEYSGYAKEGLGLDDEASEYADLILSSNEYNHVALNLKGVLAFKKVETDKALDYFQRAVDANPGYGEAYANLSVLCWKSNCQEEAFMNMQKGFRLSPTVPDNQSLYHSMASSLERFADAEEDFREACRLFPHHKNLAFLFIDLLLLQGNFNSAIWKIEDALDTFGLDEGTLNAALAVRQKIGPLSIERGTKNDTLSLCMIVKNEEKNIVKCLKSVRAMVDEMIIVDTGSTDRTKVLANIFGAKVYDFPWTGDFSAARNHSLQQATGDWILILDADEIISALDHDELKTLANRNLSSPAAYSFDTRNYIKNESVLGWTPNDGKYPEEMHHGWMTTAKVRLFPRKKDVFFINPVHEIVDNSLQQAAVPIFNCNVVVHHFGKLDLPKDMQKGEDYYLLGKMKYESNPANVKYINELAKQAHLLGKYDEAKKLWLKLIPILESDPQSQDYQDIARVSESDPVSETYMQLATAYLADNSFVEALVAARKAMEAEIKPGGSVYFYAISEIIAGSLDKAAEALEEILKATPDYSPALFLTALVCCLSDEKDKANELFQSLRQKQFDLMTARLNNIIQQLKTYGKKKEASILLNAAVENKISDAETLRLLN